MRLYNIYRRVQQLRKMRDFFQHTVERVSLPEWMLLQIKTQVQSCKQSPYSSQSYLSNHMMWCKICHNRVKVWGTMPAKKYLRYWVYHHFLQAIAARFSLPDAEFAIYLGDAIDYIPSSISLPTFVLAANKNAIGPLLTPDFELLLGYDHLDKQLSRDNLHLTQKRPLGFWRGASTGYKLNGFPRLQLAELSQRHQRLLDAKFTHIVDCPENIRQYIISNDLLDKPCSLSEQLNYKYLLDVDGHSCSYSRMYWILNSSSVLVKAHSNEVQWFYSGLKDGQHMSLFSLDHPETFINVMTILEQGSTALQIAKQGQEFAKQYLNRHVAASYFLTTLEELYG